ncbi:phosphatase PAP2 family protein [Pseudoduganella sp. RAF53_2]|uniref:phosphatase PAP2 family protein n=1 Tax=unclassified Pseudoduganella TaxID=2637179 RepID=UPI003F94B569
MSAILTTPVTTPSFEYRTLWREHASLAVIVGLHTLAATSLSWSLPGKYNHSLQLEGFVLSLVLGLLFALCSYTLWVMAFKRPAQLLRYLRQHLTAYLTRERITFALPVLLMMPLFASSFSLVKSTIPVLRPYAWDHFMSRSDAWLHGGVQPWELLQPVFGHPFMTAILNVNYHLWFFIMLATVYWLAFSIERRALRMQFLLSFVLSWIVLGNVFAILFSSVGPCYYGHMVAGLDPYHGLIEYLRHADKEIPVMALTVQDALWSDYSRGVGSTALSISAMPSMHVASAVLLAQLGWSLCRKAGIALTIFAILIFLGSIHLGWHYALDGYVGGAGAWIIWKLVGRFTSSRHGGAYGR